MSSKRPIELNGVQNEVPSWKRIELDPTPKSLIAAIGSAKRTLDDCIQTVKASNDILKQFLEVSMTMEAKNNREEKKALVLLRQREKERDPARYVWVVIEDNFINGEDAGSHIVGIFSTLKDANNRVRNMCELCIARNDSKEDLTEGIMPDGRYWWDYQDGTESGWGLNVKIERMVLHNADAEQVQDWGRHFGESCPKNEQDSESD